MARAEFGKPVMRAALKRAGNGDMSAARCEAVGIVYGLDPGVRCNALLSHGVEFDHYPIRAADGGDNSLENCAAVCPACHRHKTRTFDTPQAAKGKRVSDKHRGIRGTRGRPLPGTRASGVRKRLNGSIERW